MKPSVQIALQSMGTARVAQFSVEAEIREIGANPEADKTMADFGMSHDPADPHNLNSLMEHRFY
jgi:hypothetical protein